MLDKLTKQHAYAANAALRGRQQQKANVRYAQLSADQAGKELAAIEVDNMSLEELEAFKKKVPMKLSTKRQRAHRAANRQQWSGAAETAAPIADELAAPIAAVPVVRVLPAPIVAMQTVIPPVEVTPAAVVPADHPLLAETQPQCKEPPKRRRDSDDETDAGSVFTKRTQRATSSKSASSKPAQHTFGFFVAHYAAYNDGKKAVKLAEEAPKLDADIKAFERTLQPVSKVIGEHAKERNKYQLAYLHQPEAANDQDYVKLKEMGEKLQKEERARKQFFSGSKVAGAGNRLQLLNILSPTWAYKPEHYTEWFQRYAAIDPQPASVSHLQYLWSLLQPGV